MMLSGGCRSFAHPNHTQTIPMPIPLSARFAASRNLKQCLAGLLFCRRVAAAAEALRATKVDRTVSFGVEVKEGPQSGVKGYLAIR
jgi:hypothetical protein